MKCECEIEYEEFRTGYTFKEIRRILLIDARRKYEITNQYVFISRHTVLGRWRQIKLEMWNQFQKDLNMYGCSHQRK